MTSTTSSVISGVAYPVSSVRDAQPCRLDDFLGDTEFTVDMAGHPYRVQGCGGRLDERVRFHEKDHMVGRDIRVWRVTPVGDGFLAEHVAAF